MHKGTIVRALSSPRGVQISKTVPERVCLQAEWHSETLPPSPSVFLSLSPSLFALSFCLLTPLGRLCASRYVPVCIHKPFCPEGVALGDFSTRRYACFFPLVYLCAVKRVLDVPIINPSSPVLQIMYSRSLGTLYVFMIAFISTICRITYVSADKKYFVSLLITLKFWLFELWVLWF